MTPQFKYFTPFYVDDIYLFLIYLIISLFLFSFYFTFCYSSCSKHTMYYNQALQLSIPFMEQAWSLKCVV